LVLVRSAWLAWCRLDRPGWPGAGSIGLAGLVPARSAWLAWCRLDRLGWPGAGSIGLAGLVPARSAWLAPIGLQKESRPESFCLPAGFMRAQVWLA
jgi:hypothetical protein